MNPNDDLRELWCSQPVDATANKEELVKLVQEKTQRFDRQIFRRNLRECIAAVVVSIIFGVFAFRATDALGRTGFIIIAAAGLWIIFFILRYGRALAPPDPGLDLDGYRHALVEKYDRQIWLLKTVKFWYLLPLWIGLVLADAGALRYQSHHGGLGWYSFLAPVIYTAGFALVWWLNEVKGVSQLRTARSRVLALAADNRLTGDRE